MMRKKYILHLFPKEKFTNGYIKFTNDNFHKENHKFIVYGDYEGVEEVIASNVLYYNKWSKLNIQKLSNEIKDANKIIFHSLFINTQILLKLFIYLKHMKKFYIVFWGADLYVFKRKPENLKYKISFFIRKQFIRHSGCAITLVDGDYDVLKKCVGFKGEHKLGKYPFTEKTIEDLQTIREEKFSREKKGSINITIGNNATESNHHLDVFNMIEKFKNENVKLFVPLSYGDEQYRKLVIDYGVRKFGDRFVPVTDFMQMREYCDFISKMDVAIFNNDRQQGMGNINIASFLGSKVYIRKDTPMWEFFKKSNFIMHDVEDLVNSSFNDFSEVGDEEKAVNYKSWKNCNDLKNAIEIWDNIFEINMK